MGDGQFVCLGFYLFPQCFLFAPDKNPKLKFTKGNNSKNSWNRVMVLAHCTSPQCDLCMKFEVASFNTFEVMPPTRLTHSHTTTPFDAPVKQAF